MKRPNNPELYGERRMSESKNSELLSGFAGPNILSGMRVYRSHLALVCEPNKLHIKKDWMSESYHKRVQKKWSKRFGTKMVHGVWETGMGLLVHPKIYDKFYDKFNELAA